ncbi:MAG: hypothetical protein E6767_02935 [Dysgonomonas sp.]|nr:hypothetical protein [Dysgonomonas sp.]
MTQQEFEERVSLFTNETMKQLNSEIMSICRKHESNPLTASLAIENYLAMWYKDASNNVIQVQEYLGIKKEGAIILLKRIHNAIYREYLENTDGLIEE